MSQSAKIPKYWHVQSLCKSDYCAVLAPKESGFLELYGSHCKNKLNVSTFLYAELNITLI